MSEPRRPEDEPTSTPSTPSGTPVETTSSSSSSAPSTPVDDLGWQEPVPEQTRSSEPVSTDTTYQPAYQQPSNQQPNYQQPPPTPTYQPPSFDQPTYQQPAYQQPNYQQPYPPPSYAAGPPAAPYQAPPSQWAQQWASQEAPAVRHDHSVAVGLAAVFLGMFGLFFTLIGIVALVAGAAVLQVLRGNPNFTQGQVNTIAGALTVGAIILLVIGVPQLLAAIWAPLHKNWARVVGIIVSAVGLLLGILVAISPVSRSTFTQPDGTVVATEFNPLFGALFFLIPYGFSLLALIFSRRHFRNG